MGTETPLTPQSDEYEPNLSDTALQAVDGAAEPSAIMSTEGLLYPADVSTSPNLSEAMAWVMVEDVQPHDPLAAGCSHAAWIDDLAVDVIGEPALMSIAPDVLAHPLVEKTVHHDPDVLYVRAPALLHADIQLLTAAALAKRIPEDLALPVGSPVPPPDTEPRVSRTVGLLGVAALLIAAFATGGWWSNQQAGDGTSIPVAIAEVSVTATPASEEPTTTVAPPTTALAPPATTLVAAGEPATEPEPASGAVGSVDAAVVATVAEAALDAAGYGGISARFEAGTMVLEGVMPAAELDGGYFSYINGITGVVAAIDGVDAVSPRLFLRGDDAALRSRLKAISEERPIEFPFASAELTPESSAGLQDVAEAILANPGLRVLVAGHTDAAGSSETNAQLAAGRAGAVIRELIGLGVPVTRLQPVAYGELFPDADSSDAENRRVEFEVAP